MRVLMTTDTIGGVWTFTQELVCGLLEQGCTIALFSVGRLPNMEQREWALRMERRWASEFHFESVDAPLEWMQENGRSYMKAAPLLLRLAEGFAPEIFHSNQFCFGALPLGIPRIVTAHSDVLSWSEACRDMPLGDSAWLRQYRLLVANGLAAADAVVAPTRWMLDALKKNFPVPDKQHVIANGRTVLRPPERPRKLQAITAGRLWDDAKGIRLLGEVRSPIPMLLAGDTATAYGSASVGFAQARLVGALSQNALLELFCESAIYVCPSRYEPFGLAPLEAALCGCAVVANGISSLREVWTDGAVYFENADDLEHVLRELSKVPEALARAQAKSTERAKRFTRGAMASAYFAAFEEMCARSKELCCVA